MFDPKKLDNEALFDLAVSGKASLDQMDELKRRVEEDPLSAWFYKESLFERQFTQELTVAAEEAIEALRSDLLEGARERALEETRQRLEDAMDLDLGL